MTGTTPPFSGTFGATMSTPEIKTHLAAMFTPTPDDDHTRPEAPADPPPHTAYRSPAPARPHGGHRPPSCDLGPHPTHTTAAPTGDDPLGAVSDFAAEQQVPPPAPGNTPPIGTTTPADTPAPWQQQDVPLRRIARPARYALTAAGFTRLEHFTGVRAEDLSHLPGVGPRTVGRIRRALHSVGLAFAGE